MAAISRRVVELATAVLVGWFFSYLFHISTPNFEYKFVTKELKARLAPVEKSPEITTMVSNIKTNNGDDQNGQELFLSMMEQRHKERLQVLRGRCSGRRASSCLNLTQTNPNSMYNINFKYTVCRVQKVASSNWLRAVLVMDDIFTFEALHNQLIRGDEVITLADKQHTIKSVDSRDRREEIFKTSINIMPVRHPFSRVVSAFYDKMSPRQRSPTYRGLARKVEKDYRHLRHNPDEREAELTGFPIFEDFVNFLTYNPRYPHFSDEHWIDFYTKCRPCHYKYDFIVKMETIDDDMRYLRHKLNVSAPYDEVFLGSGRVKTYSEYEVFQTLPNELIDKLYRKYRSDFSLFGYDWPVWLPCNT